MLTDDAQPVGNPPDIDAEQTVRAALAAHRWPRVTAPLRARLNALPSSTPAAWLDGRTTRRWWPSLPGSRALARASKPDALATAALAALILALSVAAFGLAGTRPADGPAAPIDRRVATAHPSPAPKVAAPATPSIDGLQRPGRLIVLEDSPTARMHVSAVDLRTGHTEPLWALPSDGPLGIDQAWFHAAISPDGSRLAIALESRVQVRRLAPNAPEPERMATPQWVNGIQWHPDGRRLYYGQTLGDEQEGLNWLTNIRWELHALTLGDRATAGGSGLDANALHRDIDVVSDRLVAGLSANPFAPEFPSLGGFSTTREHIALLGGPGESGTVSGILLIDSSGATLRRLPASDEGFKWAASPSGRWLIYGDLLGTVGSYVPVVTMLDLDTGDVVASWEHLDKGRFLWAPDERHLVWSADMGRPGAVTTVVSRTAAGWQTRSLLDIGAVIAVSPDGTRFLTDRLEIHALDGDVPAQSLPWRPDNAPIWLERPARVIGWVPDLH